MCMYCLVLCFQTKHISWNLCIIWLFKHYTMKIVCVCVWRGMYSQLSSGRWRWSGLCPGNFTSSWKYFSSHRIRGWLVPRTGLNVVEKRKIPVLARIVIPIPYFPPHSLVTTLIEEILLFPQDKIFIVLVYSSWKHETQIIYLLL